MRKPGSLIQKDPAADEPQGFDWSVWLAEFGPGVVLNSSTWTVSGPDAVLTTHDPAIVSGNTRTQVYLAAGTLGQTYTVVNHVTTNSAPTVIDERSFKVLVQNR